MHALFCHPDKFLIRFDKKICGEDRPQITDGILIISKQLESVPLKRKIWYMLFWKRNRRILLGSQVVSSSAITFFTYSNISPTLVNINMLSFPNICIISPLKAYFDYVAKPFVTINKISIVGPCCCPKLSLLKFNNASWVLIKQGKN